MKTLPLLVLLTLIFVASVCCTQDASRLDVKLFRTAQAGDTARVRELHAQVMRMSDNLYHIGRHSSAIIKGIKCALSLLGVCDDFMAEPFHRFREPEREKVRQLLAELNLLHNTTT